jgi:beta-mannosidase
MDTLARGSVIALDSDTWLHDGWTCHPGDGGDAIGPLPSQGRQHDAPVPGTVALALHHDIGTPRDFDAEEWWYRKAFRVERRAARHYLRFEGLATIADVWLNGERILESRNMHRRHRVDVTALLRDDNELAIRFAPLAPLLAQKRPRPRWKTGLVTHQGLRWIRTTLLGRMPAWCPAVPPVGPVGGIALESIDHVDIASLGVVPRLVDGTPRLSLDIALSPLPGRKVEAARVRVGDGVHALDVCADATRISADTALPGAPVWWPHTHGEPRLVPCRLELKVDETWRAIDIGPLGFRDVRLDTEAGRVQFVVNGVPIFCRGACWTPADFLRVHATPAELRRTLVAARDAGVNMIRVGGTMAYECDAFYATCDELGILVWQDFMFANMDYPFRDEGFRAEAEAEVREQVQRLRRHACIAAYCGGSEIAQQAAMLGLAPEHGCPDFLRRDAESICCELHPGIAYFPNSPWGGALPMHVATGISHYYGVGAYRRPVEDVKSAKVRFATECLGISNVPSEDGVLEAFGGTLGAAHHPQWKARVARDAGSGYDFEDVRDFYMARLFGVDPVALRAQDTARYFALSRATSAEVMNRVFGEWRSPASGCGGGLVWFLRDLWPGAGWGLIDSHGNAKSAWNALARAWAPRTVRLTDDGLDGVSLHVLNERPTAFRAALEIELIHAGKTAAAASTVIDLAAHSACSLRGDSLLGYFTDCNNAYRFGPAKYEVIAARLREADSGALIAEDFLFPTGLGLPRERDAGVEARVERHDDGRISLQLSTALFLQDIHISAQGFISSDNHFHLSPSCQRRIDFFPRDGAHSTFEALIEALNLAAPIAVREAREKEARERKE